MPVTACIMMVRDISQYLRFLRQIIKYSCLFKKWTQLTPYLNEVHNFDSVGEFSKFHLKSYKKPPAPASLLLPLASYRQHSFQSHWPISPMVSNALWSPFVGPGKSGQILRLEQYLTNCDVCYQIYHSICYVCSLCIIIRLNSISPIHCSF